MIDRLQHLIYVVTIHTLAANLGSMATPVGNPQNLFLYSRFHISVSGFFSVTLLYALIACWHWLLHYGIVLGIVLLSMLLFARDLFRRADYSLLLTFIFFFICAGNIGHIGQLEQFLRGIMKESAMGSSILASQIISNVPAAVLLSGFTDRWQELIIGTNIGGMGTLIASLASLISFKLYLRTPNARPFRYLRIFTQANAAGLLTLLLFGFIWEHL